MNETVISLQNAVKCGFLVVGVMTNTKIIKWCVRLYIGCGAEYANWTNQLVRNVPTQSVESRWESIIVQSADYGRNFQSIIVINVVDAEEHQTMADL